MRALFVVCLTGLLVWAIAGHRFGLNGTIYHRWVWRSVAGFWQYPIFAVLSLPLFLGQWLHHRRADRIIRPIALAMLSSFTLMIALATTQKGTPSFAEMVRVLQSPIHNGYFDQAARLYDKGMTVPQWLADYPSLLPGFSLHPRNKPPGPLLFNTVIIALFDSGRAIVIFSGLLIGLLAVFSIPAVYIFIKHFTDNATAGIIAAGYFALCPSLLLIFPQFDQLYPFLTVALAIIWSQSLKNSSLKLAGEFGILFAITLFITYLPAVLVIFFAGMILPIRGQEIRLPWKRVGLLTTAAMGGFLLFYAALFVGTHFNPIATFRTCLLDERDNWRILQAQGAVPRIWPGTIPGSFSDFALGSGWIACALAILFFISNLRKLNSPHIRFATLCIVQFAIVGIFGLIPCETARLWTFMFPMLLLPAGLELASWNFKWRMTALACLLIITLAVWQSMTFFR